ncbi:MAG: Ribosomal-protein-S5p-alanine acetyltransferase, partial [uncultured Nocardioidaceae bacterium]
AAVVAAARRTVVARGRPPPAGLRAPADPLRGRTGARRGVRAQPRAPRALGPTAWAGVVHRGRPTGAGRERARGSGRGPARGVARPLRRRGGRPGRAAERRPRPVPVGVARLLGRRRPHRSRDRHLGGGVRLRGGAAVRAAPGRGGDRAAQHRLPGRAAPAGLHPLRYGGAVPVHRRRVARPPPLPAAPARRPAV